MDVGVIDAINAGGNLGIMALGFTLMKLTSRVTRLELIDEMRNSGDGHKSPSAESLRTPETGL